MYQVLLRPKVALRSLDRSVPEQQLARKIVAVTGPGPVSGGSKPGKDSRAQMPEKSGIDAAPSVLPLAGPGARPTVCPEAGTAAPVISAAATSTAERKLRLRLARRYEGSMSEAAFRQQNRSRIGGAVA